MQPGRALLGFGEYVPRYRVARTELDPTGRASGYVAAAGYDEDTTTMAVAAALDLAARRGHDLRIDGVTLATTSPAYLDRTNAVTVHAVLGLEEGVPAADANGAVRAAPATLRGALQAHGQQLILLSDRRSAGAGGVEERDGADAATALLIGDPDDHALAVFRGCGTITSDALDRWRLADSDRTRAWDPAFAIETLVPCGMRALESALSDAGLGLDELTRVTVVAADHRLERALRKRLPAALRQKIGAGDGLGTSGTAGLGFGFADALGGLRSGDHAAIVHLADGADAFIVTAGEDVAQVDPSGPRGPDPCELPYTTLLRWRGRIDAPVPRRPAPGRPLAPAVERNRAWKHSLTGSQCSCGAVHFPPERTCRACRTLDRMTPHSGLGRRGTIVAATQDQLAWSPGPAPTYAIIDVDGGGRLHLEVTDAAPERTHPGARVGFVFRRLATQDQVHNYFWKAQPVNTEAL